MLDTIIVVVIIALAAAFLARRHFVRRYGAQGPAGGCGSCPASQGCAMAQDPQAHACNGQGALAAGLPPKTGGTMAEPFCLRQARVNQRLRIKSVAAAGELGRRIRDMGLVPGTELSVIGKAPLHDPVALRFRGFTLTLRNSEADHILVEALGERP